MIENESCERTSRLIPLADDIYCLVSTCHTLFVMQFIKVKNGKSRKNWTNLFSFLLFSLADCFPATFQFFFISMPISLLCTLRTETEKNAMWQHKNIIHHADSHVSKSTLGNCIVLFALVLLFLIVFYVCTHKTLSHLLFRTKKVPSERRKEFEWKMPHTT